MRILSSDFDLDVANYCKIVVYDEEGTTKIELPKPTALIGFLDNEALMGIAEDIEKRLIVAIEKSR